MALGADQPDAFEGLSIQVYHPDSDNLEAMSFLNPDGSYNLRGSLNKARDILVSRPLLSHIGHTLL